MSGKVIFRFIAAFIFATILIPTRANDFVCLGDDAAQITFANNPNKVVPGLQQVRVMQGGYASQWALNYAAYMFMREKLGMNVTFYPTNDPSDAWNTDYWGTGYEGYPSNYWTWLQQDLMDMNLEYWEGLKETWNPTDLFVNGSVVDGGFVGIYGEVGFYIPKYIVEEYPESIVPNQLINNATLRELFRAGPEDGDYNYYQYFGNASSAGYTSGSIFGHDFVNGNKPVVWGSKDGYEQSRIANIIVNNTFGEDWRFASTSMGGEGAIENMIKDLYARRKAFLVNIYIPDNNFAVTDPITNEFQDFEKVAFPRNPSQTWDDPCNQGGTCQFPIQPIVKAANPKLKETFPEALNFFYTYQLPATQVAIILNYYFGLSNETSMTESEKWLNASCEWLRDNRSAVTWNNSRWLKPVVRYDCLNGCGKLKPNTNGANDDDYFGGTCNYHYGTCECDFDELFNTNDRTCNESCPGLIGPYLNNDNQWTFDFCSGQGICNTRTEECDCKLGYGGYGCEREYEKYKFSLGLSIVFMTFSIILAIISFLCIFWLRKNAQYKTVKALSVDMTTVFTVGLIFLAASNVSLLLPQSSGTCISWQWLFGLGGVLAIMSPLLKAYRVSRVFHGGKMLRAVKITDKMLMTTLIQAAVVELIICIAYSVVHELFGGTELKYDHDNERIITSCNNDVATRYITLASYAYFCVVLLALTYYSYGTRRALSVFKESTCAYFSSFLSLFCTLITFVFNMATDDPTFRNGVFAAAIIIVVTAVLVLFYGQRIYKFYAEPDNRNVTDGRASTATSKSFTSTSVMKPGPAAEKQNNV